MERVPGLVGTNLEDSGLRGAVGGLDFHPQCIGADRLGKVQNIQPLVVIRHPGAENGLAGRVQYALMPVWMLSTKWKDKNFLFAMNGQTGKLIGDLPIDKGKLTLYCLGSCAAAALASLLFLL